MNILFKNMKEWFGYTRGERSGTIVLLIFIFLILIARSFIPESTLEVETSQFLISSVIELSNSENNDVNEEVSGIYPEENRPEGEIKSGETGFMSDDTKGDDTKTGDDTKGDGTKRDITQVKLELNTSDSSALEALPAIGTVLSSRIIKYRDLLGGFHEVKQLKEVYGLTDDAYDVVKDKVYVDSTLIVKVLLNEADYRTLLRMPYLEKEDVDAITRYRKVVNTVNSLEELVEDKVISVETANKVKHYLDFSTDKEDEE